MNRNYPEVVWSQRDWDEAKKTLVAAGLLVKTQEHVAALGPTGRKGRATCYAVKVADFWDKYCFDNHEELDIGVFFSASGPTAEPISGAVSCGTADPSERAASPTKIDREGNANTDRLEMGQAPSQSRTITGKQFIELHRHFLD